MLRPSVSTFTFGPLTGPNVRVERRTVLGTVGALFFLIGLGAL